MKYLKKLQVLSRLIVCLSVFMALWLNNHVTAAEEVPEKRSIVLSGIIGDEFSLLMANIIEVVYERLGYDVDMRLFPGKRALLKSSTGQVDGEVGRMFKVGKLYKNLVRIPTPFIFLNPSVFAIKHQVRINSKEDLENYRSGVLRGIIFSDNLTKNYPRTFGNNMVQLFGMLVDDRVDLIIAAEVTGKLVVATNFPDKGIRLEMGSLLEIPLYHYVHKRNSHLVPVLDLAIKEMLESGEVERMKQAFISKNIVN
ncbi:MAG: transporter substrate-binding domain-containing protein [Sneathiella sp.]|nr:transporter substrate-binding domain-containing protein [Sneathiella sp.]